MRQPQHALDHWMISPPAASPDGTIVAFERTGEPQLWREGETIAFPTMAFEGAEAGDARMTSPAFSPDSRRLIVDVLSDSPDERGLFLLSARSGESTRIGARATRSAAWMGSPSA